MNSFKAAILKRTWLSKRNNHCSQVEGISPSHEFFDDGYADKGNGPCASKDGGAGPCVKIYVFLCLSSLVFFDLICVRFFILLDRWTRLRSVSGDALSIFGQVVRVVAEMPRWRHVSVGTGYNRKGNIVLTEQW